MLEDFVFVIALACGVAGALGGFVLGGVMSIHRERRIYRRGRVDGMREGIASQQFPHGFGQSVSFQRRPVTRVK